MLSAAALLAIGSLSACQKASEQTEEESKSVLRLQMTRVSTEDLSEQLALPAIVLALPDHSVKVSPGIAGKLVDVQVSPGQQIVRGQVIARLDSRQLTDQVNSAHAKVLVAQAGVQQAQTNLLLAKNTEQRNARLVEQDVGAVKDLVAAKSQVETAGAQVVSAKAQVVDAVAGLAAAQAQLTYTIVKSPITGLVAQRFLNISDSADTTTPIVQIVALSEVVIEASLPTSQPANIVPGQTAIITSVSLPGRQLVGKVQSINPVTDNQGTTFGVRIFCANPGYQLKEGMPVIATIVIALHPKVATVPNTALVDDPSDPQRKMVYVYKDGKVNRVEVQAGIEKDARVEIVKGLTAGEEIVAAGAYGIPDGTAVEAQIESLHANSKVTSKSD
jgi:RND family efflux transporter MFP subunit